MRINGWEIVARLFRIVVVFVVVLFLPAGTLAWPVGWAFLALFVLFLISVSAWLFRNNQELLAERMSGLGRNDHKSWDKVLLAVAGFVFFAWLALMALDVARYHWSHVPPWLQLVGSIMLVASFWMFFLTFRENTFLSPAVRIQKDRGQTVVSTGPYKYVRHPMYSAYVLFTVSTALFLGSWYGVAGGVLLIAIVAWRAVQEERVLHNELEGYGAYMAETRFRFVPYVW